VGFNGFSRRMARRAAKRGGQRGLLAEVWRRAGSWREIGGCRRRAKQNAPPGWERGGARFRYGGRGRNWTADTGIFKAAL